MAGTKLESRLPLVNDLAREILVRSLLGASKNRSRTLVSTILTTVTVIPSSTNDAVIFWTFSTISGSIPEVGSSNRSAGNVEAINQVDGKYHAR
ncbi:hypothetical protein N7E02_15455 [Aliirhizobium terrae]|uniref:hypothetical protein n=1 Tax=Terrirhizobium terrae TaxID=2926709 RepID=UPI0025779F1F|nr:hypothetical protein [Rhizobium sp. CC-CFT758]WJH41683.1 hypothetical protein N7E02_15455 [Rhizobium sp. CC-CFT758]